MKLRSLSALPWWTLIVAGCGLAVCLIQPDSLLACAACYGQSDAPMAQGMNWGILSLLGIIITVLGGVAAFFISLARRAAKAAELEFTGDPSGPGGRPTPEPQPVS